MSEEEREDAASLPFNTIATLPDGRVVEHIHTTLVNRADGYWTLDEHVLLDGEFVTVRVVVPDVG